jgi:hypothetical protein
MMVAAQSWSSMVIFMATSSQVNFFAGANRILIIAFETLFKTLMRET